LNTERKKESPIIGLVDSTQRADPMVDVRIAKIVESISTKRRNVLAKHRSMIYI
jgi:hypothetical protein